MMMNVFSVCPNVCSEREITNKVVGQAADCSIVWLRQLQSSLCKCGYCPINSEAVGFSRPEKALIARCRIMEMDNKLKCAAGCDDYKVFLKCTLSEWGFG